MTMSAASQPAGRLPVCAPAAVAAADPSRPRSLP